MDQEPVGRRCGPRLNNIRRPRRRQLFMNRPRDYDLTKKKGQERGFVDQDQITNRRSVANDDHGPSNWSRVWMS